MAVLKIRDENGNFVPIPTIKGDKGDKGDTPKKGVDYFTEEDKTEIVQSVTENLEDTLGDIETLLSQI